MKAASQAPAGTQRRGATRATKSARGTRTRSGQGEPETWGERERARCATTERAQIGSLLGACALVRQVIGGGKVAGNPASTASPLASDFPGSHPIG